MANIIDFDNFMKMDAFGDDMGEKMIGSVIGALMRGANCVEGSCFSLYFMLTVCEVGGEGKTGGKCYWVALVLNQKLVSSNSPCVCFDWWGWGVGVWVERVYGIIGLCANGKK